jgi:hypothetical protein
MWLYLALDIVLKVVLSNQIQGGLVPNQVPDNAIGTVNVRNAANATLVWKELKEAFGKIPHMSLILNATMTNPIKFDVIKNWREEKVMPYGKQAM